MLSFASALSSFVLADETRCTISGRSNALGMLSRPALGSRVTGERLSPRSAGGLGLDSIGEIMRFSDALASRLSEELAWELPPGLAAAAAAAPGAAHSPGGLSSPLARGASASNCSLAPSNSFSPSLVSPSPCRPGTCAQGGARVSAWGSAHTSRAFPHEVPGSGPAAGPGAV